MRSVLVALAFAFGCGNSGLSGPGETCLHGSDCASGICLNNNCVAGDGGDLALADLAMPPDNAVPTDIAPTDIAQPPADIAQPPNDIAQPPADIAQPPNDIAQPPLDFAVGATCFDNVQNGSETDVDCGGTCAPCAVGRMCLHASDCLSSLCVNNVCTQPTAPPDLAGVDIGPPPAYPSFEPPSTWSAGTSPLYVAVGDFDGNGSADVAAINSGSNDISILIGDGNGSLGAAINTPVPSSSGSYYGIVAADFSGDKKSDVVVTHTSMASGNGVESYFVGKGNGMLAAPTEQSACNLNGCYNFTGITGADLNGDGRPDVLTCGNANNSGTGFSAVIAFDDATNGTLQPAKISALASGTTNTSLVVAADFDGDKVLDAVSVEQTSQGARLALGAGDGTFGAATLFSLPTTQGNTSAIAAADVNNDGHADLIVGSLAINVLLGKGTGTFKAPLASSGGGQTLGIAVADFNHDGKLDLAVTNYNEGTVSVLVGRGDGTFATLSLLCPSHPFGIATADFNGDNKPDIVVADTTGIDLFLNTTP
jgi:hypothetical protein